MTIRIYKKGKLRGKHYALLAALVLPLVKLLASFGFGGVQNFIAGVVGVDLWYLAWLGSLGLVVVLVLFLFFEKYGGRW